MKQQTLFTPPNAGPAALRTCFTILENWRLDQQMGQCLLGLPRNTYFRWKKNPSGARVNANTLERLSYILGIYKRLHIIYSNTTLADEWVHRPNTNGLFGGKPPLTRLLGGQVADLYVVRQHLDARRGVV